MGWEGEITGEHLVGRPVLRLTSDAHLMRHEVCIAFRIVLYLNISYLKTVTDCRKRSRVAWGFVRLSPRSSSSYVNVRCTTTLTRTPPHGKNILSAPRRALIWWRLSFLFINIVVTTIIPTMSCRTYDTVAVHRHYMWSLDKRIQKELVRLSRGESDNAATLRMLQAQARMLLERAILEECSLKKQVDETKIGIRQKLKMKASNVSHLMSRLRKRTPSTFISINPAARLPLGRIATAPDPSQYGILATATKQPQPGQEKRASDTIVRERILRLADVRSIVEQATCKHMSETVGRVITANKKLLGGGGNVGDDTTIKCLSTAQRKSVWVRCTAGRRCNEWREVWPFCSFESKGASGATEMNSFWAFEDELRTSEGRKTKYEMCTVAGIETHQTQAMVEHNTKTRAQNETEHVRVQNPVSVPRTGSKSNAGDEPDDTTPRASAQALAQSQAHVSELLAQNSELLALLAVAARPNKAHAARTPPPSSPRGARQGLNIHKQARARRRRTRSELSIL